MLEGKVAFIFGKSFLIFFMLFIYLSLHLHKKNVLIRVLKTTFRVFFLSPEPFFCFIFKEIHVKKNC